jgi:hypothetical protein
MLRVAGIAPLTREAIELSGYTVVVGWNNPFPRVHIFWRTGDIPHSILEIGINKSNHVLEVARLVTVLSTSIQSSEVIDFDDAGSSVQEGVPIIDWTWDSPSPYYVDEVGDFNIYVGESHLTIQIGVESKVDRVLVADRTRFAIDANDNLIGIQLRNLSTDEMKTLRSTFRLP